MNPRRILEVRQRLHIGMTVRNIGDNPLGPPSEGTITELRHTELFIGDTVEFTDKHLNERVGTAVRLNSKTASIAVTDSEGHWRVSYGLPRKSPISDRSPVKQSTYFLSMKSTIIC
jgi:hypothetical protein